MISTTTIMIGAAHCPARSTPRTNLGEGLKLLNRLEVDFGTAEDVLMPPTSEICKLPQQ
jgi:hypothetical protein